MIEAAQEHKVSTEIYMHPVFLAVLLSNILVHTVRLMYDNTLFCNVVSKCSISVGCS